MKRSAAALIDESRCIGCRRCIDACPVDAIIGAQGLMHTVVESWCIGCALCLPPCPVDCIAMVPPRDKWSEPLKHADAQRAGARLTRIRNRVFHNPPADERKRILADILSRKRG